jgi:hypothetical protein
MRAMATAVDDGRARASVSGSPGRMGLAGTHPPRGFEPSRRRRLPSGVPGKGDGAVDLLQSQRLQVYRTRRLAASFPSPSARSSSGMPRREHTLGKSTLLYQLFRVRRFPIVLSIRGICFRSKANPKAGQVDRILGQFRDGWRSKSTSSAPPRMWAGGIPRWWYRSSCSQERDAARESSSSGTDSVIFRWSSARTAP